MGFTGLLVVPLVACFLAFWLISVDEPVSSVDLNSPSWSQPLFSQNAVPDFAVRVIEEKKPIVTTGVLPTLKVHESDSPWVRMHTIAQPYGQIAGITWHRPWKERIIQATEFFSDSPAHYYFVSPLTDLPESLQATIPNLDFLSVPWRPLWKANLWMGKNFITTPAHYDVLHNFYCQIQGQKRFILFPPSDWEHLYLYPRLHPSTRMSQYDGIHKKDFPAFEKSHPLEYTLGPGDVLYIPPYWFHHVTAMGSNTSISLSVHTESDHVSIREDLINFRPPIHQGLPVRQRASLLAFFIVHIFDNQDKSQAFISQLLKTRFSHFRTDTSVVGLAEQVYGTKLGFSLSLEGTIEHSKDSLREAARSLQSILNQYSDPAIRDIELGNYIEDISNHVLKNVLLVFPFLEQFERLHK